MLFLYLLLLIAGFIFLIKGADLFVDGSTGIARLFNVPGLIIGLTIVALGTSAPELAVSTSAAIAGSNEIALSNVTGSNIFNLLCVLGVCAIIKNVPVENMVLKRDFPVSVLTSLLIFVVTCGKILFSGKISEYKMNDNIGKVNRVFGIVLIVLFVLYILLLIYNAKKSPADEDDSAKPALWKCLAFILIGIAMIVGGGQAVVNSAKYIARVAKMTETLIGLTIVAVGTSLPELVTSIVAAKKGETGLAIGNAIGSNIFNLLLILGLSAVINPIAVNLASAFDMTVLLAVSIITYIFAATGRKITCMEGVFMLFIYVADVIFAVMR